MTPCRQAAGGGLFGTQRFVVVGVASLRAALVRKGLTRRTGRLLPAVAAACVAACAERIRSRGFTPGSTVCYMEPQE